MSRKVGRAGTPFWTHRGWGVCCLPGCSAGSGLEFRGRAGEESTQLDSRLLEAVMLPSQRREVEMRLEEPGSK